MIAKAVRQLLSHKPFQSFDVVLLSGQRHRVRHPECAVLTKTQLVVVGPDADSVAICQLLHVVSVEKRNGRKSSSK
ncbi:MAG: hypothetical protein SH850_26360 [Planctomycetaceae bacterium]|nr:hypothetical protein [Planctomycetaceae bacterium]